MISPSFEVTEAQLTIQKIDTEEQSRIQISLKGPEWGYRLIDLEGSSNGDNPPMGIEIQITNQDGTTSLYEDVPETINGVLQIPFSEDMKEIQVTDIYGNHGLYTVPE